MGLTEGETVWLCRRDNVSVGVPEPVTLGVADSEADGDRVSSSDGEWVWVSRQESVAVPVGVLDPGLGDCVRLRLQEQDFDRDRDRLGVTLREMEFPTEGE